MYATATLPASRVAERDLATFDVAERDLGGFGDSGSLLGNNPTIKKTLVATNLVVDPQGVFGPPGGGKLGWNTGRWAGSPPAAASHVRLTGRSDGPRPDITNYVRKTWTVAPAALPNTGDSGFDHGQGGLSGFAVTPGQTYTISSYLRPSVQRNFEMGVYQYTPAGAAHTTARTRSNVIAGPPNVWTRISFVYTVPAGVGFINLASDTTSLATNGNTNWLVGSTLDGTALMVELASTLNEYYDGSTPDGTRPPASIYDWTAAANASTSTRTQLTWEETP